MAPTFKRIAVLGATGPTGGALASELARRKCNVGVVSRRADVLKAHFPAPEFEKKSGDAMEFASLAAALQGCDLVIDCIGLPGERMADHPATARNIAQFVRQSGARCMQVSSYWSFMPIKELPASEGHILRNAGGTDDVDGVAVAGIRHAAVLAGPERLRGGGGRHLHPPLVGQRGFRGSQSEAARLRRIPAD